MAETAYPVALCQMSSGDSLAANLEQARRLVAEAAAAGARLVCLPEMFTCMAADSAPKHAAATRQAVSQAMDFLAGAAREHGVHLAGGSIGVAGARLLHNRSLLYAPDGALLASYDKIHLFRYRGTDRVLDETADYVPGAEVVTCDTPLGRIGLSICYDVRFPELYRRMARPDVILVPAAFTRATGKAHWELLLRARAVENLCHVVGTAQCGEHPGGLRTWGHSLVAGPWGDVTARFAQRPGVLMGRIDLAAAATARARLPALDDRHPSLSHPGETS